VPTWDGVDCALFFGDKTIQSASRVEFVQLKYSSSNPEKDWSVARLCSSSAKTKNNSAIRKLATDFTDARGKMRPEASLIVRFVSNQNASDRLRAAAAARWTGPISGSAFDIELREDLEALQNGSGLSDGDFPAFIASLDLSGCGTKSRFALREDLVFAVSQILGDDADPQVNQLLQEVRNLMQPERAGEVITERQLLTWFDVTSRESLFPAPPDLRNVPNAIRRAATDEVLNHLRAKERIVLIHGAGGCGKTTLTQQLRQELPPGSISVLFDCFGGGQYVHSDDKRHRPENAFLQIANEIALSLNIPIYIPRSVNHPVDIRMLLSKLRIAGKALQTLNPEALLVVIADAADNSVTAATTVQPSDPCFVFELAQASLNTLPENVRFIFSARTGRKTNLKLPTSTKEVVCPPFNIDETRLFVQARFSNADEATLEQFHTLSRAIPRVQTYALARISRVEQISDYLMPNGKSLSDVLNTTFEEAYRRHGSLDQFNRFLSALDCLPGPAAVEAVADIVGVAPGTIGDITNDLWPGLRLREDTVSIADEDFEQHIHQEAASLRVETTELVANYFSRTCTTHAYSAIHVADALIKANRGTELLAIIELDPHVVALTDAIARRQTQLHRLKLSVQAYAGNTNTVDTLKALLLSAEADRDESTINEVLNAETDLAAEFGGASFRRQVLLDRDRIREHGALLIHDAARAARAGIRATAREQFESYRAWLKRRKEQSEEERGNWAIDARDLAAYLEVIVALEGPDAALDEMLRWTPRFLPLLVASILVPQLLASGRVDVVRSFLANKQTRHPWSLVLTLPLALAGEPVDRGSVGGALKRIRRQVIPNPTTFESFQQPGWKEHFFGTLVASCELGYLIRADDDSLALALRNILAALEDKRALIRSDFHRMDGLIRCWMLTRLAAGENYDVQSFLAYVEAFTRKFVPKREAEAEQQVKVRGRAAKPSQAKPKSPIDEDVARRIRAVFSIYAARARILTSARKSEPIDEANLEDLQSLGANAYEVDHDYDSGHLRGVVAESVMQLQMVPGISVSELLKRATKLSTGRFDDWFVAKRLPLWQIVLLRVSEAAFLVRDVATRAASIQTEVAASSDKVGALIKLSRLLLHVSRDDAAPLFDQAINTAKELDREAIDQIDFMARCASRARFSDHNQRKLNSGRLFVFTSGAAERLRHEERFPWNAAIDSLVSLAFPVALAAISRWADEGLLDLGRSLPRLLTASLDKKVLPPETASALSLLLNYVEADFDIRLGELTGSVLAGGAALAEEVSKDILLLRKPWERLDRAKGVVVASAKADHKGYWISKLGDTARFLDEIPRKSALESHEYSVDTIDQSTESPPKVFEANIGGPFASAAAIEEVLRAGRDSGLRFSEREALHVMMEKSSQPKDRVGFLNALCAVDDELIWGDQRARLIKECLEAWGGTPAIGAWTKEALPKIIAEKFSTFIRYLKDGGSVLPELLAHAASTPAEQQAIILQGVTEDGGDLSGRTLFGVAELLVDSTQPADAATLLDWYAPRLENRIPLNDRASFDASDIPEERDDAIARLLFAQFGDIDTRLRWRAAHALRRLARLGVRGVVEATINIKDRTSDKSFRDPTAPFYFLAAKLWLAMTLSRIGAETPSALANAKAALLQLATDANLPHVVIREHAKRALMLLAQAGSITLSQAEQTALADVNAVKKGHEPASKGGPSGRYAQREESGCVFKFDQMDTVPYWYDRVTRMFPGISHVEFLRMAERWIMQQWGAPAEANYWDTEPRKGRYDERRFGTYSHSHGSLPIMERYGTYLEWHAMYCVAGELLETYPVAQAEYDDETERFASWLESAMPTDPPLWFSDLRGPTPLDQRLWVADERSDVAWTRAARMDEFLEELDLGKAPARPGWIVVSGDYSTSIGRRRTDVRIATGLVGSRTAAALTNALNSIDNAWSFKIPDEDDDLQIDEEPYRLLGWIAHEGGDTRFDDRDPLRHETGKIRSKPGAAIVKHLRLKQVGVNPVVWTTGEVAEATFIHEAWSDEPNEDERQSRYDRTEGWRLWARTDAVASFLAHQELDLICEVELDRRLEKEYSRSHDKTERKGSFHKAICFRANGAITIGERDIGAWASSSRRAESFRGNRHARKVDGTPSRRADGKR
jgi:hypothetical protein